MNVSLSKVYADLTVRNTAQHGSRRGKTELLYEYQPMGWFAVGSPSRASAIIAVM